LDIILTPLNPDENQFGRFCTPRNTLHKSVKQVDSWLARCKVPVMLSTAADECQRSAQSVQVDRFVRGQ
jgi:hypothetical protein